MLPAYVADTKAVLVHLMFDPRMAGKKVAVRRGLGAIVDPYVEVLQILPTGDCTLNVRLDAKVPGAHLIFHCNGIQTILPMTLTSAQVVAAAEQASYRPTGL
jgi:hypothetical protein